MRQRCLPRGEGQGLYATRVNGHACRFWTGLHVPDLDVNLLSTRIHCCHGPGCAFIADNSGCFLTFPGFIVEVDDAEDCLVDFSLVHGPVLYDFDEFRQDSSGPSSVLPFGSSVGRAHKIYSPCTGYNFMLADEAEVGPAEPTLPNPVAANCKRHPFLHDVSPLVDPVEPGSPPIIRPCEVAESHLPTVRRFTSEEMFSFFGGSHQ